MATQPPLTRNESRTSSLSSRLFRSKSGEGLLERRSSGSRLRKNKQDTPPPQSTPPVMPSSPPRLPEYKPEYSPQISTAGHSQKFGSRDYTNGAENTPPVPPIPANIDQQPVVDPYARSESMTHRGRYSYAHSTTSTVNSPRRVRRRKDPTPFNVLVIGARNSGKTSLINFLKTSLALPPRKQPYRSPEDDFPPPPSARQNRNFTHHYQEIEIDNERVGLTLWDSQGLDKGVVDLQMREMTNFVESKFDETFAEEMKVIRSPGARDTHIHCIFLVLDPARLEINLQLARQGNSNGVTNGRISKHPRILGILDEDFELQVLRALQGKTSIIPIISKADTITIGHMNFLKRKIAESLQRAGLDPLEAITVGEESDSDRLDERDEDAESGHTEDDEDGPRKNGDNMQLPEPNIANSKRQLGQKRQSYITSASEDTAYVPFSILSPDEYSLDPKDGPVGRHFPWGFADPYNADHCDFVRLRDAVFSDWRLELREASREKYYESWRTNRLNYQGTRHVPELRKSSGAIPIQIQQRIKPGQPF